jgi:hypothetical protein
VEELQLSDNEITQRSTERLRFLVRQLSETGLHESIADDGSRQESDDDKKDK